MEIFKVDVSKGWQMRALPQDSVEGGCVVSLAKARPFCGLHPRPGVCGPALGGPRLTRASPGP